MSEAKKSSGGMASLIIVLAVICAVTAALLGLVNAVTIDAIAANTQLKTENAMNEVLPADGYEPIECSYVSADDTIVVAAYSAGDAGWVFEVASSGFGGTVDMMVGVAADKTCSGVAIITHAETSGLGANATKADWRAQFVGLSGTVGVTKDGGDINAITGSTITSRAVCRAVTTALAAADSVA